MFFANEQRDKVRTDNPDLKFGDVGKVLGQKWKELSDAQKAPYEKKAAADKKRYEDEKAAYNAVRVSLALSHSLTWLTFEGRCR